MFDLGWLLAPYEKSDFFNNVWQKKPELLATNRVNHFRDFFSKKSVEKVIEFSQPNPPSIRLASTSSGEKVAVPISENGRINIDHLRKFYSQGQTVILNSVEDFDPLIASLARAVETEMGARVQINSYLTPPSAQGLHPHYDTHDVLVAQIEGEKLWKIYGSDSVCPLNEMFDGDPKIRESAAPPEEINLCPGDLLYIPRGWVHEAATQGAASLHITIGIHPPLGKDLLSAALNALVDQHPLLREALPVGPLSTPERTNKIDVLFSELMKLFSDYASGKDAAEAIDDELLRRGRSGGDGHLFDDIEYMEHLSADSKLERRTDIPCRIIRVDDGCGLQFLNSLIRGPDFFEDAMRYVAEQNTPFAVSALPNLNLKQQIIFSSSLIRDGLCKVHRIP